MQNQRPRDARRALQRGDVIDAIETVRERNGSRLDASKEPVDRHAGGTAAEPARARAAG